MSKLLSAQALSTTLSLADLTDSRHQNHAMQLLVSNIQNALVKSWNCNQQIIRTSPVVPIENNYDRLGYPPDGAARNSRYTRYITDQLILRTQTSAAIPDTLRGLSVDPPMDLLLVLPGLVYRRDSIDRLHCGEPHQLDLWRIVNNKTGDCMTKECLQSMIDTVMNTALPTMKWRTIDSPHPYTEQGVQIDVAWHGDWIEVGECGVAAKNILEQGGLKQYSGLAMGLGLDRLLMLRKNIPDIRLLRNQDERVLRQMNDLKPYKPVSDMPIIRRDLSLCVDELLNEEIVGDILRNQLKSIDCIEALHIKSECAYVDLPSSAHKRMGMVVGQKNILLEITIRHMDRTLTSEEGNEIRNDVYKILHKGNKQELAMS